MASVWGLLGVESVGLVLSGDACAMGCSAAVELALTGSDCLMLVLRVQLAG